jgi:NADP-reducing hydrogenase subunit HndB
MPRIENLTELISHSQEINEAIQASQEENTIIIIGMGTCGQAAGAGDTLQAIQRELTKRDIQATIRSVGCIGMCVMEPLVDIQLPGQQRVTYTNVLPSRVSKLIGEHIVNGQVVHEWAIGTVPADW